MRKLVFVGLLLAGTMLASVGTSILPRHPGATEAMVMRRPSMVLVTHLGSTAHIIDQEFLWRCLLSSARLGLARWGLARWRLGLGRPGLGRGWGGRRWGWGGRRW